MQLLNHHKMALRGILLSLVVIGTTLSCASAGKTGAAFYTGLGLPTDPVPFMPTVRRGTLPNGLRYYILENGKPENRAYLTLAVNAGSVLEQDDEQGLAHFIEHMAFNGTARFPESELIQYLRSLGMRFGPEVNAYTSYDETVYGIEVPTELDEAGHKQVPAQALAVLDDWTHAITFDPKDVDDERRVIMEEYRSRLGATERIRRQILPILFQDSPYANRSPIGIPEIIEQAPPEKLKGFYETWYRPDNMALILVGDFDGAALEGALASHFTASPAETPLNHPRYDLIPPRKEVAAAVFTDPELPFTLVNLYYKRSLKARGNTLADYREGIVDYLIDQILSERFDDAASQSETPYLGASSGMARFGAASRYYIMTAQAKTGKTEATLQALLREKESMVRYGFTDAELDRAKRSLIAYLTRLNAEQDRQESSRYVQNFTYHFLQGEMVPPIAWELEAVNILLPGINLQDLSAAVKDYFAAEDLWVFVIAPEGEAKGPEGIPTPERIKQMVSQARKARIPRPRADPVSDELMDTEPPRGAIVSESTDPETGAIRWELSNGAQVILKGTRNRNNELFLYALARGGTVSAPEAEDPSARLAAEMLGVSGIGPYSRQELVKKLAGKQVSLSFWASPFLRGFQGSATTEDTQTLFEMLYLSFTQPRMDTEAINALLDQYRTILTQEKEDPQRVFSKEIQKIMYGNHPRFSPRELEHLALVNQDDALSFIQDGLTPGDYTFVFTGNLDLTALRTYTKTYLASIPRGKSWNTWADPHIIRPGKTEKVLYKGKEAQSMVYLGRYIPFPYTEEDAAAVAVLEEYLDIRLTEEIREKLGGVYSVSAAVFLSPLPPGGELGMAISFGCDPQRVEELCAAIEAEVVRTVQEPLEERIFNQAVAALQKSWEASIQSNSSIAQSYANSAVIYGLPLSRLDNRPGLYEGVRPEAVQAISQRLISTGPARVVLYPEGWTP
ncbi:MAG: insulinase family protein [Treponema sp.]|jgi:zinc protease|nr:insulinase family protein [Treponema sp.]